MKKPCLFVIFIFYFCADIDAQDFETLASYEFSSSEEYKSQENTVLQCANYLFDNPADVNEQNRLIASQFILKWMTGTPDHSFQIGAEAMELVKGSDDLLLYYMAALSKRALEMPGKKLSADQAHEYAKEMLVDYCSDPANHLKPSKAIKKILKGRE